MVNPPVLSAPVSRGASAHVAGISGAVQSFVAHPIPSEGADLAGLLWPMPSEGAGF